MEFISRTQVTLITLSHSIFLSPVMRTFAGPYDLSGGITKLLNTEVSEPFLYHIFLPSSACYFCLFTSEAGHRGYNRQAGGNLSYKHILLLNLSLKLLPEDDVLDHI